MKENNEAAREEATSSKSLGIHFVSHSIRFQHFLVSTEVFAQKETFGVCLCHLVSNY